MRTIRMYHHPVYNSTHQSWRQCTSAMLFQDLHTERHCEVLVFYTKKKDMTSSSSASDLSVSEGTDSDFEVSERFESDSRPVFNIKRPRRNEPTCDDVLGTHGLRMISCMTCSHLLAWLVAYAHASIFGYMITIVSHWLFQCNFRLENPWVSLLLDVS